MYYFITSEAQLSITPRTGYQRVCKGYVSSNLQTAATNYNLMRLAEGLQVRVGYEQN